MTWVRDSFAQYVDLRSYRMGDSQSASVAGIKLGTTMTAGELATYSGVGDGSELACSGSANPRSSRPIGAALTN